MRPHGLCLCITVFSAWLAMPVCACVQVAHDPGSAGRFVSFMSSVQFLLKSGSGDKRITPVRYDSHTLTHTRLAEKCGNKVALWRALKQTTFKIVVI